MWNWYNFMSELYILDHPVWNLKLRITLFIWNPALNTVSVMYSFLILAKNLHWFFRKTSTKNILVTQETASFTSKRLLMLNLSNNRGFVTNVCFSLKEESNDWRLSRSNLLEVWIKEKLQEMGNLIPSTDNASCITFNIDCNHLLVLLNNPLGCLQGIQRIAHARKKIRFPR